MVRKKEQTDWAKELEKDWNRWNHLYRFGGSDPFYTDGVNLNLVRNHIFWDREKIKEEDEMHPALNEYPVPPEVPNDYMVNPEEIREKAKRSLQTYKENEDYQWLKNLKKEDLLMLKDKDKKILKSRYDSVLSYVTGLEMYIKEDSLVEMRRHCDPDRYLTAFGILRMDIKDVIKHSEKPPVPSTPVGGQYSIFDYLSA